MKFEVGLVVIVVVMMTLLQVQSQEVPSQFRNIKIENYLKNTRAVQFQLKCVIYDGPCDAIGKYIKKNFPVWLKSRCENCSPEQKERAGRLIKAFQDNFPKEWDDALVKFEIREKFSPEEIKKLEEEYNVKITRDPSTATKGKPDTDALAKLAKESVEYLKTTPEPLIISNKDTGKSIKITDKPPA